MAGAQPSEWTATVSLLLLANGGGTRSFEQYRAWLEGTGFAQVRQWGEQ